MTDFKSLEENAEKNLDALFTEAFDTNHPAMLDWAVIKLKLKNYTTALQEARDEALRDAERIAECDENIVECNGANSYYCQLGDAKATAYKIAEAIKRMRKEKQR